MFILKCCNSSRDYILSAPRKNRKEGCTITEYKTEALRFKTAPAAKAWLADVKTAQKAFGFKEYQLAKAYPVPAQILAFRPCKAKRGHWPTI